MEERREAPIRALNDDCFENVLGSFRGKKRNGIQQKPHAMSSLQNLTAAATASSLTRFSPFLPLHSLQSTRRFSCPGLLKARWDRAPLSLPHHAAPIIIIVIVATTPSQFLPAVKPAAGLHVLILISTFLKQHLVLLARPKCQQVE